MRVHVIVSSSASESDCDGSSSCQNCDNAVDLLLRILVGRQDYVAYQRNMESTAQNSCDGWNNTGYQRGTPFIVVKLHNKRSLVFLGKQQLIGSTFVIHLWWDSKTTFLCHKETAKAHLSALPKWSLSSSES
jgi:hypothetical protein